MIRPEIHQWNWKPKTRSKDDIKLDKDLEILRKKLGLRKNELTRMALSRFSLVNEIKLLKSNQEVN